MNHITFAASFSALHFAIGSIDMPGGEARVGIFLNEMLLRIRHDPSSLPEVIDEVLCEYLQTQISLDKEMRLTWFRERMSQTISYLRFRIARRRFSEELFGHHLDATIGRLQSHAVDVEAGVYALRDVKFLVAKLSQELKQHLPRLETVVV